MSGEESGREVEIRGETQREVEANDDGTRKRESEGRRAGKKGEDQGRKAKRRYRVTQIGEQIEVELTAAEESLRKAGGAGTL